MNVSRRGSAPSRLREDRDEAPRRRRAGARAKPRRSRAVSLGLGLYKGLVILSALIVAAFLAIPYWKSRYFSKASKRGAQTHA